MIEYLCCYYTMSCSSSTLLLLLTYTSLTIGSLISSICDAWTGFLLRHRGFHEVSRRTFRLFRFRRGCWGCSIPCVLHHHGGSWWSLWLWHQARRWAFRCTRWFLCPCLFFGDHHRRHQGGWRATARDGEGIRDRCDGWARDRCNGRTGHSSMPTLANIQMPKMDD